MPRWCARAQPQRGWECHRKPAPAVLPAARQPLRKDPHGSNTSRGPLETWKPRAAGPAAPPVSPQHNPPLLARLYVRLPRSGAKGRAESRPETGDGVKGGGERARTAGGAVGLREPRHRHRWCPECKGRAWSSGRGQAARAPAHFFALPSGAEEQCWDMQKKPATQPQRRATILTRRAPTLTPLQCALPF